MDSSRVVGVSIATANNRLSIPFYGFYSIASPGRVGHLLSIPFYGFPRTVLAAAISFRARLSIPFYGFWWWWCGFGACFWGWSFNSILWIPLHGHHVVGYSAFNSILWIQRLYPGSTTSTWKYWLLSIPFYGFAEIREEIDRPGFYPFNSILWIRGGLGEAETVPRLYDVDFQFHFMDSLALRVPLSGYQGFLSIPFYGFGCRLPGVLLLQRLTTFNSILWIHNQ